MKHHRYAQSVLLAVLIASAVSCAADTTSEEITGSPANTESALAAETETVFDPLSLIPSSIPETDFGGSEFHILRWGDGGVFDHLGYVSDGLNGELLNDTIYQRNSLIEEKYNVKITSEWVDQPASDARKAVSAGDTAYDLISDWSSRLAQISVSGVLLDLYTAPYLDFTAPWWDHNAVETYTIRDRMYFTTGDFVLFDKQRTFGMFFNSTMANALDIEDLYTAVNEGRWTLDLFNTCCAQAIADLDGNGKLGEFSDRFGLVSSSYTCIPYLLLGCGSTFSERTQDGRHTLAITDEHTVNIIDKLGKTLFDDTATVHMEDINKAIAPPFDPARYIFQNNQALFMHSVTEVVRYMDMDDAWGILPQPKYDEAQEKYLSAYQSDFSASIGIPTTAVGEELEMICILLEALSAVSHETTYPAFIEDILMNKKAPDAQSVEMLRIIYGNLVYDMFDTFQIGNVPSAVYSNLYTKKGKNFISDMEKLRSKVEKSYSKLLDDYDSLE